MSVCSEIEDGNRKYTQLVLENGLRLLVAQTPHIRSFAASLVISAGLADGRPHLSHLIEHLVVRRGLGTRLPDMFGAFTSYSSTAFNAQGHIENIDECATFMRSVFEPLELSEKEVETELSILHRESIESGYGRLHHLKASISVVSGANIGNGYKGGFWRKLKFNATQCKEFHGQHYRTDRAFFVAASPWPKDRWVDLLSTIAQPEASPQKSHPPEHVQAKKLLTQRFRTHRYATITIWHLRRAPTLEERIAAELLDQMLGARGDMFEVLRGKNPLSYGTYSACQHLPDLTYQVLYVNVPPMQVGKSLRLVSEMLEKSVAVPDRARFEAEVKRYCQGLDLLEENSESLSQWLRQWGQLGHNELLITPSFLKERISNLTHERFQHFVEQFLKPDSRHVYLGGGFNSFGWLAARKFSRT